MARCPGNRSLDPAWDGTGDNVYGVLPSGPAPSDVAGRFAGAGWPTRPASWSSYEVETGWCRLEIDRDGAAVTLLSGVVDPRRFDDLAALLTRLDLRHELELYGDRGALVRERKG
ncbi:hypothetical protein HDA32_005879 [Spinactinospora alkalitolerans]|uniref:Uncharacterized protein n=1 Tax=Spinactinospora alkalitolerans TaxID=687207 RepID=A0A852U3I6_9ACTN|nr:hypothetical protein [Spinactinospora alkalitolerans]NYE50759.1 hypothetical protein [Spinactinospora alkalitolerans]